jgi:hypothetical protein
MVRLLLDIGKDGSSGIGRLRRSRAQVRLAIRGNANGRCASLVQILCCGASGIKRDTRSRVRAATQLWCSCNGCRCRSGGPAMTGWSFDLAASRARRCGHRSANNGMWWRVRRRRYRHGRGSESSESDDKDNKELAELSPARPGSNPTLKVPRSLL